MTTNTATDTIITRFPPSPTGPIHIGNVRTMIFNHLFARQHGGKMMVRFEDTDRERSKPEYESFITEGLAWLGVTDYEAPLRQSERSHIYRSYLEKLIEEDRAYISNEEPKEANQRSSVIRFRNPNTTITFTDLIRGEVTVDTTDLGDFVIAKSLDEPIYHFAVVVDDYESGITHVIRGEDHISNTPRQILIQQSLGAPQPTYAHLPMVLGPDKAKLSKRHGSTSLDDLRHEGYLPNAVFNYLTLLGWHPGDGEEQEIFTPEELVQEFKLEDVQKSGAVFSEEKLRWVNKQHLDLLSDGIFFQEIQDYLPEEITNLPQFNKDRLARLIPELRERVSVYSDILKMAQEGELEYFFDRPDYFTQDLVWRKSDHNTTLKHLQWLLDTLEHLEVSSWNHEDCKDAIWPYAEREGKGDVLWPLRYSLSGMERSPDPISLLTILGREESLQRIATGIEKLQNHEK